MNINLIPSWKDFFPAFKSPPFNTINGVHYGVSLQWGPNVLMYNTKDFPAAAMALFPIAIMAIYLLAARALGAFEEI